MKIRAAAAILQGCNSMAGEDWFELNSEFSGGWGTEDAIDSSRCWLFVGFSELFVGQ